MMLPDTKMATMNLVLNLSITGQAVVADQVMMDEVMSLVHCLGFKALLSRVGTGEQEQLGAMTMSDQDILAELEAQPVDRSSVANMDCVNIDDDGVGIWNDSEGLPDKLNDKSNSSISLTPNGTLISQSNNNIHDFEKVELVHTEQHNENNVNPSEGVCADPICYETVEISGNKQDSMNKSNVPTLMPSYPNGDMRNATKHANDYVFVDEIRSCADMPEVVRDGNKGQNFPHSYTNHIDEAKQMTICDDPTKLKTNESSRDPTQSETFPTLPLMTDSQQVKLAKSDIVTSMSASSESETGNHKPIRIRISKGTATSFSRHIKCPLCNAAFETFRKFTVHLTRTHYVKKLMSLFGPDKSTCPICKHEFAAGSQKRDKAAHLGLVHKNIFAVSQEAGRAQARYRHKRSFGKSGDYVCPMCSDPFSKFKFLRYHLARVHFREEIFKAANVSNNCKQCPECNLSTSSRKNFHTGAMASHLGSDKHGYLEKVLPQRVKDTLTTMKKKHLRFKAFKKSVQKSELVKVNGSEVKSELGIAKPKKGAKESYKCSNSMSNGPYACPMCDSLHRSFSTMKEHLSRVHFSEEILKLANATNGCKECPDCGKEIKYRRQGDYTNMAVHLGSGKHDYLDRVLPPNVLNVLNATQEECKENGTNLLRRSVSKSQDHRRQWKSENTNKNDIKVKFPNGLEISSGLVKEQKELKKNPPNVHDGYSCPICSLSFCNVSRIRRHLASVHFKDEILKAANIAKGSLKCPLCCLSLNYGGRQQADSHLATHLGSENHGYLNKVLPANIQEALEKMRQNNVRKDDVIMLQKATNVMVKPNKKEKQEKSSETASVHACPLCPLKYNKRNNLLCHLAMSHYSKMVFNAANVPYSPKQISMECQLCRKMVGHMSRHLGVTHGFLQKVIPAEEREKVFGLLEPHST